MGGEGNKLKRQWSKERLYFYVSCHASLMETDDIIFERSRVYKDERGDGLNIAGYIMFR